MIETLILALQAYVPAASVPPMYESPEAYAAFVLDPEFTRQWEQEAPAMCAGAGSPAECRPAYLAARHSEAAVEVCRHAAGLEFRNQHGTTTTTYAQHSIRRACRASIEFCRAAWLNYDRINFSTRPASATDPRRTRHFALFLNERCGSAAGVDAPF